MQASLIKTIIEGILCVAGIFFSVAAVNAEREAVPNVIIITIEGVRGQDTVLEPHHQYIPHFWNLLRVEGTLFTDVVDLNRQFHMPVVGCINTGKWHPLDQEVGYPTIFQYARRAYGWPKEKTWAIGEWNNQSVFVNDEFNEESGPCRLTTLQIDPPPELKGVLTDQETIFFERYRAIEASPIFFWPTWDSLNEIEHRMLKKVMKEFKPKLIHYIANATETAHFDDCGRYLISVRRVDEMIYDIWKVIRSDPFYRDNTYLFVTPDHERNALYMDHTENPVERPSRVWLYIYGPKIKKDYVVKTTVYHTDIFPTVAYLLGLSVGQGDGKVLHECFSEGLTGEGKKNP